VLDSVGDGSIYKGNIRIKKENGMLIYQVGENTNGLEAEVIYNTLSTPPGGQYQVQLADGTKVWLNAESSLYFPSAFKGDTRQVAVRGEAYFEVAVNKEKPFHVKADDVEIKVLGTHFNINAYKEENRTTTSLLEGSVQITTGTATKFLKPGEQGVLKRAAGSLDVRKADMDQVVAWKNGLFNFTNCDFPTIMHQIGRWYNVDVEFQGEVPNRRFEGKISRGAQLPEILQILELQNIKFEVTGRKIIVRA
jgi:ferric-dicitrate binding protein FerR (iron transport regulator)